MKAFLLVLTTITLFSVSNYGQTKFWEDLNCNQKAYVLNACKSESIKKLYKNELLLTPGKKETLLLLNELVNSNDTILPLTFSIFNQVLKGPDAALGEVLGQYCVEFTFKHPTYVLEYFKKEKDLKTKKPFSEIYAMFVGSELYLKQKGYSSVKYDYNNLKKKLDNTADSKKDLKETLRTFWQLVDETIKEMK
jgi:hypothetical protein